jgi:hypothetical protein
VVIHRLPLVPGVPRSRRKSGSHRTPRWWTAQGSSSVVPVSGSSRARRKDTSSWRKLHLGVDADTGQIIAAELTGKDADDGSQVGARRLIMSSPLTRNRWFESISLHR